MDRNEKFVEFHKYCKTCEHETTEGFVEPCNECLEHPVNYGSEKPVKYTPDEKKIKKESKENG